MNDKNPFTRLGEDIVPENVKIWADKNQTRLRIDRKKGVGGISYIQLDTAPEDFGISLHSVIDVVTPTGATIRVEVKHDGEVSIRKDMGSGWLAIQPHGSSQVVARVVPYTD